MRPGLDELVNLRTAARILGVSDSYLRKKLVRKKKLLKVYRHPVTNFPFFKRTDLVSFMVKWGYDPEAYRMRLQPKGGHLLAVGAKADVKAGLRSAPIYLRSALSLGMHVATMPVWGVVMDFDGLGRRRSLDLAAEIHTWEDFPLLIAIASEDEACQMGDPVPLFDLTLSRPLNPGRLAVALNRLRRSVLANTPRIADPEGKKFQKVGTRRNS